MESLERIKARAEEAVPGATIKIIPNASPANQPSLLIDSDHTLAVVQFLRNDAALRLDFCSNVTGVDWLDRTVTTKVKVRTLIDGEEKEIEQSQVETFPGYLETVYHLYSIALKHGPVVIRLRTANRADGVHLPSLTPVYRSAEFQEREIFDLYGMPVRFPAVPSSRVTTCSRGSTATSPSMFTFLVVRRDRKRCYTRLWNCSGRLRSRNSPAQARRIISRRRFRASFRCRLLANTICSRRRIPRSFVRPRLSGISDGVVGANQGSRGGSGARRND